MGKQPLLLSILAVLAGCGADEEFDARGCLPAAEDQASCPSKKDVPLGQVTLPGRCGDDLEVVKVKSEGELTTLTNEDGTTSSACCYTVVVVDHDPSSECAVGRPYYDRGAPRRAPVFPLPAARVSSGGATRERAAAWSNAGAAEHASVAAFGRLALQLMALGAPLDLVRDTHHAALDEIGHSELCWSLARRFGDPAGSAGPFPLSGPIDATIGLAELALQLVRDGCVEETLGAHLALELAAAAPEPDVRAVLTTIAAEESQHAVLSFTLDTVRVARGAQAWRELGAIAACLAPARRRPKRCSVSPRPPLFPHAIARNVVVEASSAALGRIVARPGRTRFALAGRRARAQVRGRVFAVVLGDRAPASLAGGLASSVLACLTRESRTALDPRIVLVLANERSRTAFTRFGSIDWTHRVGDAALRNDLGSVDHGDRSPRAARIRLVRHDLAA